MPGYDASLPEHPLAAVFDAAPADFADEPLYGPLCRLIARNRTLLAWLGAAPATQRKPNLVLAALHHEVLRLTQSDPASAGLAAWFADVGGTRSPDDPALSAALAEFCDQHASALVALIQTQRTQTNEIGRCAVLRPALVEIARRHGRPLALFDFGCSAGLNLLSDQYRVAYQGDQGAVVIGPDDIDTPELDCRLLGPAPDLNTGWAWADHPQARIGCDLAPPDIDDDDAMRWLQACLWPSDSRRRNRLLAALGLARRIRPPLQTAADGLALLPAWLESLPAGTTPVLFNSWVLYYFDAAMLAAHSRRVRELVQRHGLLWLSAEDAVRTAACSGQARHDGGASDTFWSLTEPGPHQPTTRLLARSHPHGAWLEWLAG